MRLQVVGTIYRIDGYKANNLYGYMRITSYDRGSKTSERKISNGVWSEWAAYASNSELSYTTFGNCINTDSQKYCIVNNAYTDGGMAVINGTIKEGVSGQVTLFTVTDARYWPRSEIFGCIGITATSLDEDRIHYVRLGDNGMSTAWMETLEKSERFSIVYPLRH